VHRDELKPNTYNPNKVAPPELELLIVSIMEDGWTQPVVALPDNTLVDGFHRWHVSADPRLIALYGGMVPVAYAPLDPLHRQMSTIRHNRARGTHGVIPMADIVRGMVDEGVTKQQMMTRLGMEAEEVDRLVDRAGMPDKVRRIQETYSKAWVPALEKVDGRAGG
jgi:ParB-like chromosome segregation protein Spo0J